MDWVAGLVRPRFRVERVMAQDATMPQQLVLQRRLYPPRPRYAPIVAN